MFQALHGLLSSMAGHGVVRRFLDDRDLSTQRGKRDWPSVAIQWSRRNLQEFLELYADMQVAN
jgi:hypothetical protein